MAQDSQLAAARESFREHLQVLPHVEGRDLAQPKAVYQSRMRLFPDDPTYDEVPYACEIGEDLAKRVEHGFFNELLQAPEATIRDDLSPSIDGNDPIKVHSAINDCLAEVGSARGDPVVIIGPGPRLNQALQYGLKGQSVINLIGESWGPCYWHRKQDGMHEESMYVLQAPATRFWVECQPPIPELALVDRDTAGMQEVAVLRTEVSPGLDQMRIARVPLNH